ncbi:uncharacterized protein LOC110857707 [Folsomia candida]|uniref:uncharacterized protein LOC110857707 n=1 Tax=Folsomia candida TaxID=158441 RepID=UPI001605146C|nr:uncharacterized protein LOC110857707 [Folsomia candida]
MAKRQNCAVRQALQNPLILQQIFKNGSVSGKKVRLVCHLWNEIVLSHPQPKLTLFLHTDPSRGDSSSEDEYDDDGRLKGPCSFNPLQLFCVKMEPRLARCIKEYQCISKGQVAPWQKLCAIESRVIHVTNKFNLFLEHVTINFYSEHLIPTLYEILKTCCPNLKRLEICFEFTGFGHSLDDNSYGTSPLCIRPMLTFIKILDLTVHTGFFKMTQLVLNSAPNLTHFTYHGDKFPDLSRNVSIKMITFGWRSTRLLRCNGLKKMLDQVKDQLEFLHVKSNGTGSTVLIDVRLPKMKRLKEFRNEVLDCFSCGDQLQDIYTERMPCLERLLIFTIEQNLTELLRTISRQSRILFSGVKHLHVPRIDDPEVIVGLKMSFPKLESLTIDQRNLEPQIIELGSNLRACTSLGLKYLKLFLLDPCDKLSEVIRDLSTLKELFPSLKTLEIEFHSYKKRVTDDLDLIVDGTEKMKQWFLAMKGLENVTI